MAMDMVAMFATILVVKMTPIHVLNATMMFALNALASSLDILYILR
jgi:hypothetical protein